MNNFKKITIILIITTLIVLCLSNTVMAKEYKGKLKYDKNTHESYYGFDIKKENQKYSVYVNYVFDNDYSEEGRWRVNIARYIPEKNTRDVSHGHKKEIIKKNGKIYVGTKYKYDYKKKDFVVYDYKLVKKIHKSFKIKLKVKMTDFKYFSMKTKYKTYIIKGKYYTNKYYNFKTKELYYTTQKSFYLPRMYIFESIII